MMLTIEEIQPILHAQNVAWMIHEKTTTRNRLDVHDYHPQQTRPTLGEGMLPRGKIVIPSISGISRTVDVIVLDHHNDVAGKTVTGERTFGITPYTTEEYICDAVGTAKRINNPHYTLPEPQGKANVILGVILEGLASKEYASHLQEQILHIVSKKRGVQLAYAEIIFDVHDHHVLSSTGFQESFQSSEVNVEIGLLTHDGEGFYQLMLKARREEELSLAENIARGAEIARSKREHNAPRAFEGPVILVGNAVKDFFAGQFGSPFAHHTSMEAQYNKETTKKKGDSLANGDLRGDSIHYDFDPTIDYGAGSYALTPLGAVPTRVRLIEDSRIVGFHGGVKFAAYANTVPTGQLSLETFKGNVVVSLGKTSMDDLIRGDCGVVSDFAAYQISPVNDRVNQLISAALLHQSGKVIPFKGGNLTFSYANAIRELYLSREEQINGVYRGPMAVRIEHARITGNL